VLWRRLYAFLVSQVDARSPRRLGRRPDGTPSPLSRHLRCAGPAAAVSAAAPHAPRGRRFLDPGQYRHGAGRAIRCFRCPDRTCERAPPIGRKPHRAGLSCILRQGRARRFCISRPQKQGRVHRCIICCIGAPGKPLWLHSCFRWEHNGALPGLAANSDGAPFFARWWGRSDVLKASPALRGNGTSKFTVGNQSAVDKPR